METSVSAKTVADQQALSALMAQQFDPLLIQLRALEAAAENGLIPADLVAGAVDRYVRFCAWLNETIGYKTELPDSTCAALGAMAAQQLEPYVAAAASASRWRSKPRGYAGDDLSIRMIYDHRPSQACDIGEALDSLFLGMPAACAVRNRRQQLAHRIMSIYSSVARTRPVRITAFAAGPASEIFDAWQALGQPADLHACLVDGDPLAIDALKKRSMMPGDRHPRTSPLLCAAVHKANLAHVALGKTTLEAPPQDLVYSLGLTDYLKDEVVIKLLDVAYGLLRPGGTVIIGNFHVENPDRACLDHVINWRLIHRTEADMHRLMSASRFAAPCTAILREPTGVQMLAVAVRPPTSML